MRLLKEILANSLGYSANNEDPADPQLDQPSELGLDDNQELDQIADKSTEDPNKAGLIRKVKGAHLVYKREQPDGRFEELWIFNSSDAVKQSMDIRSAIIAGTDIPVNKTSSPDGEQSYQLWTAGNAEILNIVGLQN